MRQYQETREEPLDIEWHPFDLRSQQRGSDGEIDDSADDGKDEAYYEQAIENVRRLQERYDVEMTLELATEVDSLPAQIASVYVKTEYPEQWLAFDERIFEALWQDGEDIEDVDVLADLAEDAGLDGEEISEAVTDAELRERVFERFEAAQ